jgi:hypothetical protein
MSFTGARPEASLAEEQQLQRRVGLMFELVVQLLRLLEFAVTWVGAAAFAPGSMNMQRQVGTLAGANGLHNWLGVGHDTEAAEHVRDSA